MKKRILCLILVLTMLVGMVGVLAACGGDDNTPTHTHQVDSVNWAYDDTNHWHACTANDGYKTAVSAHTFGKGENANKCTRCEYTCDHEFDTTRWEKDGQNHWNPATCGHTSVKGNVAAHTFNGDVCTTCNYDSAADHIHTYEWDSDEAFHQEVPTCGCEDAEIRNEGPHTDASGDGACDVCGRNLNKSNYDIEAKYDNYDWDTTTLYVCLNENSNQQELSSELRRYLAGDIGEGKEEYIDGLVSDRNENAIKKTNVKLEYIYWGEGDTDDANSQWGHTITRTIELVKADAPTSPDIYCNQIYDMVSASLQGCFANIRSTTMGNGENYFSFTEDKFNDLSLEEQEEFGYMMEYMTQLGFSVKKQYLIASDYFIDLVRAFFVVPLNIDLLTSIDIDESTGDRDGDKDFDTDDFYAMVMNGEWTYDILVKYGEAVFSDETKQVGGSMDNINGFILSHTNGMISSALLYTTSIKIFDRHLDKPTGFYNCTYPETNEELFTFCEKLATMVSSKSVYVTNQSHLAVRDKFTSNQVLFGGIILLGSLEYQAYQDMKKDDGFGILPVPLYQQFKTVYDEEGKPVLDKDGNPLKEQDKYLTIIHNMGRIAGIAANTDEFVQASAYIDFQSTHSTAILEEYYEYKLQYEMAGGTDGNIKILKYIRENVRSAFDKTYEDAIGYYFKGVNADSSSSSWAGLLSQGKFQVTTMRDNYVNNAKARSGYLAQIVNAYEKLPA